MHNAIDNHEAKILPPDVLFVLFLTKYLPVICHISQITHSLGRTRARDGPKFCHFYGFSSNNHLKVSSHATNHNIISKASFLVIVQKICNLSFNCHPRLSVRRDRRRKLCFSQVQIQEDTDEEACELVNGIEVSIGEGSDSVAAYLLTAVKNNNGTGILLLSDVFGFEDSATRDFAYRIACNGYNVLLPDLFNGDPWQKDRPKDSYEQWRATHTQTARNNITASIKWMVDEFIAAEISKKFGVVGFCFGGGKVIDVLAEDHNDYFALGVSFYGTSIQPSVASKLKVPVLYITGDEDPLSSVKVLEDIERDNVVGSRAVVFKGRGHGFVHRPATAEDDEDAEEAFTIMRNWLHNGLVVEQK